MAHRTKSERRRLWGETTHLRGGLPRPLAPRRRSTSQLSRRWWWGMTGWDMLCSDKSPRAHSLLDRASAFIFHRSELFACCLLVVCEEESHKSDLWPRIGGIYKEAGATPMSGCVENRLGGGNDAVFTRYLLLFGHFVLHAHSRYQPDGVKGRPLTVSFPEPTADFWEGAVPAWLLMRPCAPSCCLFQRA